MRLIVFPSGEVFEVRFYQTSGMHTVVLPAGTYEGETVKELTETLREEFDGVEVR